MRRRWPGGDRGSFTAEYAAGLPALLLLLYVSVSTVNAVNTKIQCVDAAREAALAAARGEPPAPAIERIAPPGATYDVAEGTDLITVTVTANPRPLGDVALPLTVTAEATAAREP
ncbi:TadE family type IV pilus minor pilin [Actinoplanes sp. NPDC051470]|uniref:TadE family type IV pilus minor pilin n=1 Tax=Actinoplanes sp. NPDC051470 TaxID=3157224 RepID=UPI0034276187